MVCTRTNRDELASSILSLDCFAVSYLKLSIMSHVEYLIIKMINNSLKCCVLEWQWDKLCWCRIVRFVKKPVGLMVYFMDHPVVNNNVFNDEWKLSVLRVRCRRSSGNAFQIIKPGTHYPASAKLVDGPSWRSVKTASGTSRLDGPSRWTVDKLCWCRIVRFVKTASA